MTENYTDGSGTATTERIFLFSYAEIINAAYGFSASYSTPDEARPAQASTYARARGTWWSTSSSYLGSSCWWLRSAGDSSSNACNVYYIGFGDYDDCVCIDDCGARPALKINLTSSSWNYAGTVCTNGNVVVICMEHEYIDTLVEPTCTEAGYIDHTCSRCGDSYQDNETDALGHVFGDDDTCTRCGASSHTGAKDDEIPLTLGVTQTATITTGDSYLYYVFTPSCSCNYTFYSTGSHDTYGYLYDSSYSQLTSNGDSGTGSNFKYTYTLTAGEKYYFGARFYSSSTTGSFDVTVDILHNYETATVEPTCTEVGYTTYTCSICGDTYTADEVPATGHSYTDAVTAPTETNRGYTTHTCSVCGHSYVDSYTDPIVTVKTGWQKIDGKWYYYNTDGSMAKGWKKISGKWYYFKSTGVMATGWLKLDGKWYYFDAEGVMATGWLKLDGKWYYFQSTGVMKAGWLKLSGKWYYLQSSGAMKTGWLKLSGKWYWFNSSGVMAANKTVTISGKAYNFDANGVCTNP